MRITVYILFIFTIVLAHGCIKDCMDLYGKTLRLEVPMTLYPLKDTFRFGDTLWIETNFSNNVLDRRSGQTILLDSFTFFTKGALSEISDTSEQFFGPELEFIKEKGEVDVLPLNVGIALPIQYAYNGDNYSFKAGIVLPDSTGLYWISFSSNREIIERYDHPALVTCDNNRRNDVLILYKNEASTQENYEQVFLNTKVDYLQELISYERYQDAGAFSFYLKQ